jgi:ureidoacrylate peracid hydrolase
MHEIKISPTLIERAMARRGRVHPFEAIEPARTALIVVDMQNGFVDPALPISVPVAREIVPNINRLAAACRAAGSAVVWLKQLMGEAEAAGWDNWFDTFVTAELRDALVTHLSAGAPGFEIWPELEVDPADEIVVKNRFSAFIQGASDIEARLRARGIDTLLITGTVTNVCCESTARDAAMLNYKVIMVSDANAARSDEDHNASLNNMFNIFADVQSTDEVIGLLNAARTPLRESA